MARSGFGSIRRLPSGRYQARYTYKSYPVKAPLTFESKRAAEDWLTLQKAAILTGDLELNKIAYKESRGAKDVPLQNLADKWLKRKEKTVRYSSYKQFKTWHKRVTSHFAGKTVRQIDSEVVRHWAEECSQKVSRGVVFQYVTTLKGILDLAMDEGIISENPAKPNLIPKSRVRARTGYTLEEGELEKLIAASAESFRLAIYLGAVLGLRRGEIIGLKTSDLSDGVLRVRRSWGEVSEGVFDYKPTKTEGSNRDVPVPNWLVKKWNDHVSKFAVGQVMFVSGCGNHLTESAFHDRWNKAKKSAGVNPKLHFHDLRGYAATEFVKKGATEREVMALLGHTSTQVSISYQKATLSALSEVMEGRRKA